MKLFRFLPALIWMVVIFYFSSVSTTGVPGGSTQRFLVLKSLHLIEYATLAGLLFIGFLKYRQVIITAYLYAISDEIHQHFVFGRTSKFTDTLIDLLGICLGLIFIKIVYDRFQKSQNRLN